MSYLSDAPSPRATPQTRPAPGKAQVPNSAGGYAFALDPMARLARFLVLGTMGGTLYASQRDSTRENLDEVRAAIAQHGDEALELIVGVSAEGRAPRNDEAVLCLAIACAHPDRRVRTDALSALPEVCRTGTHLLQFMEFVGGERGRGRALNAAVGRWYTDRGLEDLAYQLVKYRQRGGWSQRDVLRLVRPTPPTEKHDALFRLVVRGEAERGDGASLGLPPAAEAYVAAQKARTPGAAAALVRKYGGALPREALQSEHVGTPEVMAALLEQGMPLGALVRNLGNLTRLGVLKPMTQTATSVAARLRDASAVEGARLHPMAMLTALATYRRGQGVRGGGSWDPVGEVVDALDDAFYLAFANVRPTGKRHLLGIDVSGSMGFNMVAGSEVLSCRVAAAAMAMVTMRSGDPCHAHGFSDEFVPLPLSPRQRLDAVVREITDLPFTRTDCSLPMVHALEAGLEVDTFVVYTDNETYAGAVHPHQALEEYRRRTGIPARLAVVGMASNGFTIADPSDAGQLDVVGMDAATPAALAAFSEGA